MSLKKTFAKFALSIGAAATLSVGMAGLARAEDGPEGRDIKGTYTLKNDQNVSYGIVQIRECGQDMCMQVVSATPEARNALGVTDGKDVVAGLKSDGSGGYSGGEIVNTSGMGNGADVTITPDGGEYKVVATKMWKSMEARLERSVQTAAKGPKAPGMS